jgi:hypothetical protein
MNRTTLLRRHLLLGGLTMPALVPIARAQGSAAPPPGKAPFGLTWGMSAESVRSLGTLLSSEYSNGDGSIFKAYSLPHQLHDISSFLLFFGVKNRLFHVVADSRNEYGLGFVSLERYRELAALLSENYGEGSETELAAPYSPDSRLRYTSFQTTEMYVELSLRRSGNDGVYLIISANNFAETAAFRADQHASEKDAL